jgi:hypothetical protein
LGGIFAALHRPVRLHLTLRSSGAEELQLLRQMLNLWVRNPGIAFNEYFFIKISCARNIGKGIYIIGNWHIIHPLWSDWAQYLKALLFNS